MQTIRTFTIRFAVLALLTLAANTVSAQDQVRWSWDGTLAEGRRVFLHNVNGEVRIELGSGNAVQVRAEKRWRLGNPDDVRIEARQTAGGDVLICALWREGDACDESGIDRGRRDGSRNDRDDVSVQFTVTVPPYAAVDVNSVNGDVTVAELRGEVDASTVNGDVSAASSGAAVQASTVNGSIRARGRVSGEGLDYSTVNGSIEIELPTDANADLDLRTVNGRVTSDFPITFTGEINPRRIRAALGAGGPRLRARTVNGGIRLRKQ